MFRLHVNIEVNNDLYVRNPDLSKLGKSIIEQSIVLIQELGFEAFTIKKLSTKIGSPESSIYRYFDSKQMILQYLIYWYWSWIEYRLVFGTNNITSPNQKLESALKILTESVEQDSSFSHINEVLLDQIIKTEAVKAYFVKTKNPEATKSLFEVYQRVVERVSQIILEINNDYQYPHMLISTVIEGSHQQRFFADNIPQLTDVNSNLEYITDFYTQLVINSIKKH